jgi:polar amino acid transport system substrate-binding protein
MLRCRTHALRLAGHVLALAIALHLTPAIADTWQVAGDEQFAPYSYLNPDDDIPHGLDVELVSAILKEAGVTPQVRLYPWQRVKRLLDRREVVMAFQFADTPERRAQYTLVGPLRSGSTVFMTTAKTAITDWRTFDDLQPYVMGQVRGYAYDAAFDKADLARDTSAQNPRQLVSMLLAGRIDIIVGDRVQLLYFIKEQRALEQVRILPTPLVAMSRFVAFDKQDAANAERFAAALERLRRNGSLQRIEQRWAP